MDIFENITTFKQKYFLNSHFLEREKKTHRIIK